MWSENRIPGRNWQNRPRARVDRCEAEDGFQETEAEPPRMYPKQEHTQMTDPNTRWYRSQVDLWLAVVLAVPPLAIASLLVRGIQTGRTEDLVGGGIVGLLIAALYAGLLFPIRYGISRHELIIQAGWLRQRIALAAITEVYPTRNPLSAPALSLDRLHVQYDPRLVNASDPAGQSSASGSRLNRFFHSQRISPADRAAFLSDLAAAAGLERHGDCLKREQP